MSLNARAEQRELVACRGRARARRGCRGRSRAPPRRGCAACGRSTVPRSTRRARRARATRAARAAAGSATRALAASISDCGLSTANRTPGISPTGGADERAVALAATIVDRLRAARRRARSAAARPRATTRRCARRARARARRPARDPTARARSRRATCRTGRTTVTVPTRPCGVKTATWRCAANGGCWPTWKPAGRRDDVEVLDASRSVATSARQVAAAGARPGTPRLRGERRPPCAARRRPAPGRWRARRAARPAGARRPAGSRSAPRPT